MSLAKRLAFIKAFPCFSSLSASQIQELANLFTEVRYEPRTEIVKEGELIDSIYIIVEGQAEVTHTTKRGRHTIEVPIAALLPGEGIGLNDTGFYSTTGKRTATVSSITSMLLLALDLKDLYAFLHKHHLELSMYAASKQMLFMRFIKQSLPFSKLSHERLRWLADKVEELTIDAGEVLFHQGEQGDTCYLIKSGAIEILSADDNGAEHRLALLKPPVLFGEATLITHAPRNATARAVSDCELLALRHEYLSELIESEDAVANMFMTLMVDRSRPLKNPNVTVHKRIAPDGQEITILKNSDNSSYFKLSPQGVYIWQQLNGQHTLQDITLSLAEHYKVFAPDVVAALISKLTKAGFISNLTITDEHKLTTKPFWVRGMVKIRKLLEARVAFGDADRLISTSYQKYVRFLFTKLGQTILALLTVLGFAAFVYYTPNILLFFSFKHISLLLLLTLIPLGLVAVLLHELGHAFAVKAFGREVHYIGVGWYWFAPIAFTDTSDMWLSSRKPRMLVNLAGIYVDLIVAGIASLLVLIISNPYIQAMLWLFALYTYVSGFRNLSPLQEMDGYYVLMDWVEKTRLRQSAVLWLIKKFPRSLRHPRLFKENLPEVYYWSACLIFLVLVSLLTLLLQGFVLVTLGIESANPYLSLILPLFVVIFSCLSIIADIRNQSED